MPLRRDDPTGRVDPRRAFLVRITNGQADLTPTTPDVAPRLERRGRAWLVWSFLLCPCHLPWSLAALTAVLAGTSFGVMLREHVWVAATALSAVWAIGTGYGFWLIRQAERANGTCPVRTRGPARRAGRHRAT
jgi:hypothetical protein